MQSVRSLFRIWPYLGAYLHDSCYFYQPFSRSISIKIALYAVTSATSGSYSKSFAVALLAVFRSLLVVPRRFRLKLRLHLGWLCGKNVIDFPWSVRAKTRAILPAMLILVQKSVSKINVTGGEKVWPENSFC